MDISATAVRFDDSSMWVDLSDGRTLGVPYAWFRRLLNATPKQREAVEIGRFGLHWEEIDEDISIAGLLAGRRDQTVKRAAPDAPKAGRLSPSGVWIADDFRTNLIIDRYDPIFTDMRTSKLKHMRSENSEDVVTWNVFRSLRQIAPEAWLPRAWESAFPTVACPPDLNAVVKLWETVAPPPALRKEGRSEVDIIIETRTWVWFIEAKYRSDISLITTARADRDQVIRNIDIGSFYAGARKFAFSLLILSQTSEGVERIEKYKNFSHIISMLGAHRPDGLQNIAAVDAFTWAAMADVLLEASRLAPNADERIYAERALNWLNCQLAKERAKVPHDTDHGPPGPRAEG